MTAAGRAAPSGSAPARSRSTRASTGSRCARGRPRRHVRPAGDGEPLRLEAPRPAPPPGSTSSTGATASSRCGPPPTAGTSAPRTTGRSSTTAPARAAGSCGRRSALVDAGGGAGGAAPPAPATGTCAVDADGVLRADARGGTPPPFTVELVADGRAAAAATARRRPTSRSSWSATTRWSTAGRPRTAPTSRCRPPRRRCSRAVRAANPRTVLVVLQQLPVRARRGADRRCRRSCGRRTAGRSTAPRSPRCCSARANPGGRLTQTWYRSAADLPDLLDYDIIGADATYLYFRGDAAVPVRPRAELHHVRVRGPAAVRARRRGRRRGDRHRRRRRTPVTARRRRGRPALHATVPVAGQAAAAAAARRSERVDLAPGERRTVEFAAPRGGPRRSGT